MYATNQPIQVARPVMLADTNKCAPTAEIAREHYDLLNETERLASTVKELIDKLRPVIRALPSPERGVGTKREDCYSELGNEIRSVSDRLRAETDRLRDVLETLAV